MPINNTVYLVYDTQCPICDNYCTLLRIRESVGELKLIDARNGGELVDEITARGWDIDQGMVLKMNNQLYYGDEAIHMLALISLQTGAFNRLNYFLFSRPTVARILYPILRGGRNLVLKALRRTKINNLGLPGSDQF